MLIGYARVSTQDQNLDLQKAALIKPGVRRYLRIKSVVAAQNVLALQKPWKYSVRGYPRCLETGSVRP